MSLYRDPDCVHSGQREAVVKPVIITSLTVAGAPSKHSGKMAAALEYEVFCPNCARVEIASTCDLFNHKCNCDYGVSIEMLRNIADVI